jgi:hypothetical protein
MVPLDHDSAVAIIIAMVPASVMVIELGSRPTVIAVTVVVAVAADPEPEFGRAGDRWGGNGDRSHGGKYKLLHVPLQSLLRTEGKRTPRPAVSGTPKELF